MAVAAVPTGLHEEVALQLADAGVHTASLKSRSPTIPRPADASRGLRAKGLIGAVGHIERFNPSLQSLRKRLENGELGRGLPDQHEAAGPFPARIADVGVVKDLGTHDIDLTAWLAQSNFINVVAHTTSRSGVSTRTWSPPLAI
jgi:UDP-N-acetylglucosamine 3-dehydrogenase